MLEKIKNKKCRVGVFLGGRSIQDRIIPKYYEGVIRDYDDNFIMFDDGSMIGIKYIQTIEVI